ncbi:MAG: hypothetical protein IJB76_00505 [Clostridia bacterium]|nr:hypothetical protein [Clostridia bacterium]
MTKIRTYKKFTLVYNLEETDGKYLISIIKDGGGSEERSSYTVWGDERELKALLCRMWGCSVTPMSLKYILQDEGFLPQEVEESKLIHIPATIAKRKPISEVASDEMVKVLTGKA